MPGCAPCVSLQQHCKEVLAVTYRGVSVHKILISFLFLVLLAASPNAI